MSSLIDNIMTSFALHASGGAMGTKVSEYIESKVPRRCNTCEYYHGNDKQPGTCCEPHVEKDPEVQTKGGKKIVEPVLGCCRFWEPRK